MGTVPIRLRRQTFPLEGMVVIDFGNNNGPPDGMLLILAALVAAMILAVFGTLARANTVDAVAAPVLLVVSERRSVMLQQISQGKSSRGLSGGEKTRDLARK